jgi:hypothetical protein
LAFAQAAPRTVFPTLLGDDAQAVAYASVVMHTDWSGAPSFGVLAGVILTHGIFASCPMVPAYYEPDAGGAVHASPVGEATAVLAMLHSFPEIFRDAVIVSFTDNDTFRLRFLRARRSRDSEALDQRLRDIAITLTSLNARLLLARVSGSACLADNLTRIQDSPSSRGEDALRRRLHELLPSRPPSRRDLRLPTSPPSLLRPPPPSPRL